MMKKNRKTYLLICGMLLTVLSINLNAQSGKITGRVYNKETNEPLPGANIIIQGSEIGAAADTDGLFTIVSMPPGEYTVIARMMGYAEYIIENVTVDINRTTVLDVPMQQEAVIGQSVIVVAEKPPVHLDVSSSQKIISAEMIESRPMVNLEEVLSTEAGISLSASSEGSGLIIRGGGLNETDIIVDGLSTRDLRTQQPSTIFSLTAIEEIEVLTGGFNAEYGNIRSGMVSIATKEGSMDRYSLNLDLRSSPPARKHFGPSPFSIEGPFWQVYTGPDAFTGVTEEMVKNDEYPFTFIGWNKVAQQFVADPDPSNDKTPQELLEIWKWQHRIRKYADEPDYIIDGSFSGKIPLLPVTFMLSERYENLQLAYPMSRNNSISSSTLLKLTTYLAPDIKLSFNNIYVLRKGVSGDMYNDTYGMIDGTRQGVEYARDVFYWRYMWHDASYNPITTQQYRGGLALNHILSSKTFYDLRLEYTNYSTIQEPIRLRDTTGIKKIGNTWYDEAPFGYVGSEYGSITEQYDILGEFLMSGGGRGQDHSKYWDITLSGSIKSQVHRYHEMKAGFTFSYTELKERREINHGATTQPYEEAPWNWWYYDESPIQLGAYLQDKMEYGGMIANAGLRLDYMKYGKTPYNLDPEFIFSNLPYTLSNFREQGNSFSEFTTSENDYKLYLSPRLGISHPITVASKVFFNYGHFYQPPVFEYMYTVKPYSRSAQIPNISIEWPRTIMYEIGYEQGIGKHVLLHFLGYYKDVSDQISQQDIIAINAENQVTTWANNSYADIRGLELKLEKRTGRWIYGWISFEYMAKSEGFTGLRYIYEDRQKAKEQAETTNKIKNTPVPSVTSNITFTTPKGFGPSLLGLKVLADWRLNILFEWSDGGKELLNPDALLSERHYVEVIDWWNTDVLLEKQFYINKVRTGFFMQVTNLFNFRGFPSPLYWNKYVDSLHFPHETGEQKGNDKLGEWDKDYIELGWNTWQHFVNPRDIFFGVRVQF